MKLQPAFAFGDDLEPHGALVEPRVELLELAEGEGHALVAGHRSFRPAAGLSLGTNFF